MKLESHPRVQQVLHEGQRLPASSSAPAVCQTHEPRCSAVTLQCSVQDFDPFRAEAVQFLQIGILDLGELVE